MSASSPSFLTKVAGQWMGFTKLSKGLTVVLAIGFAFAAAFPVTTEYLALLPGKTIPFTWNLLTAGLFERSFLGLIISIFGVLLFGKLLEPIWSSREFLRFLVIVSVITSVDTFVISILLYYITTDEGFLYTPISGFHGVLAGFLVAVKQINPDLELNILHIFKLRLKWLPILLVTVTVIAGFLISNPVSFVPYIVFGTYSSWIYLRYFQRKAESSSNGDRSDEFSFATFFPAFMGPVIDMVASVCEKVFCGRRLQNLDEQGAGYAVGTLPGSEPAEATRRRERGARALEERLSAATKGVEASDGKVALMVPGQLLESGGSGDIV